MNCILYAAIRLRVIFIFFVFIYYSQVAVAGNKEIKRLGDVMMVLNPVVGAYAAAQESGLWHFSVNYGASTVIMAISKEIGRVSNWKASKRPVKNLRCGRFDGMPSGHTVSAWAAASYARVFLKDKRHLVLPLYIGAIFTAYSRVESKRHTIPQVVVSVLLCEGVNYFISKTDWSKNYQPVNLIVGKSGAVLSFKFNI